ncbi:hypothetical protein CXR34_08230 [Microbacterium hominis]|uniref:Uncharacterized protein n=1 Tax=Microbacterium hominis TaxID=162426 RepID=A0A2K9D9A2_9MICO|nr:hypothetical protein CXR34_08230 [Microbacterium hominis]
MDVPSQPFEHGLGRLIDSLRSAENVLVVSGVRTGSEVASRYVNLVPSEVGVLSHEEIEQCLLRRRHKSSSEFRVLADEVQAFHVAGDEADAAAGFQSDRRIAGGRDGHRCFPDRARDGSPMTCCADAGESNVVHTVAGGGDGEGGRFECGTPTMRIPTSGWRDVYAVRQLPQRSPIDEPLDGSPSIRLVIIFHVPKAQRTQGRSLELPQYTSVVDHCPSFTYREYTTTVDFR